MSDSVDWPASDSVETGQEETQYESPAESQEAAGWFSPDDFKDMLPAQYELLKPTLEKYEAKHREEISAWEPYAPFKDRGAETVAAALTVFDRLDTPEGAKQIYEAIGEHLGLTAKQVEQLVEEESEDEDEEESDDPRDQIIRELQQQVGGISNVMQQAQHQAAVEADGNMIDTQVRNLFKQDADLQSDQPRLQDLMERAYNLNERIQRGERVQGVNKNNLIDYAYQQQKAYNQNLFNKFQASHGGRTAPMHVPPSGGNPGSGIDPSSRDADARMEAMAERLRSLR